MSKSKRKNGAVLFARLQELDANGTLSKALNRKDVALLAGYSEDKIKAGCAYVGLLIRRGYLSETLQKWKFMGKKAFEYHMTGVMPDCYCEQGKRKEKQLPEATTEEPLPIAPVKIEFARGDTSITVEAINYKEASKLIATVLKGE